MAAASPAALMGFWEDNAEREAEVKRANRHPQDAAAECGCGHVGVDVLLGICAACFEEHLAKRHHAVKDRLDEMDRH